MTIERATIRAVAKPWGSADLRPWSPLGGKDAPIGELWFERADASAEPALLVKLLFTTRPLSIQVHPDDDYAHTLGLPHGKTEAWYVISAEPQARIGLGLERRVTSDQLRASIEDRTLSDLVRWQAASAGDTLFVPAGTIHAIGAGLVIAEIQQRSDTTFRLFDYERHRELQIDHGLAAATAGPAAPQTEPIRLSAARRLLVSCGYFVLEHVALRPETAWELTAGHETWLLPLEGSVQIETISAEPVGAVFIEGETVGLRAGPNGLRGLIAYAAAAPQPNLLLRHVERAAGDSLARLPRSQELPK